MGRVIEALPTLKVAPGPNRSSLKPTQDVDTWQADRIPKVSQLRIPRYTDILKTPNSSVVLLLFGSKHT
jgi:hypothetical protein